MNKTESKFIVQALRGISGSSSVLLSEIARKSVKGVEVKKTVERFSRRLCALDRSKLELNYIEAVKDILPEGKIYFVDDSEIVKPCAKKMEGLGYVSDGSDGHKLKLGYHLHEIVAIDKKHQPVSVSTTMYTSSEPGFCSANDIKRAAITQVIEKVGSGVFVFDRGFDDVKLHKFMEESMQKYIVRAVSRRSVYDEGMLLNIKESAQRLKGEYSFSIKYQRGKKENLKAGYKKIQLPAMPNRDLNMVVVYGFSRDEKEPFYLLTNLNVKDKESCLRVIKAYITRWKIEEYYKFKKQAYGFEDIRIRKLEGLKSLNVLLTAAIGFLFKLENSGLVKMLEELTRPIKLRTRFLYYRIHAGFLILSKYISYDLLQLLYPKREKLFIPKQIDFFHYLRYSKQAQ